MQSGTLLALSWFSDIAFACAQDEFGIRFTTVKLDSVILLFCYFAFCNLQFTVYGLDSHK